MNNDGAKEKSNDFVKLFDKCPACGKNEPFFGMITEELKKRGIVDKDWQFYLDCKSGAVMQPGKEQLLPVGSEVPGYFYATDICSNCGKINVVKIQRLTLKKSITVAHLTLPPNRAERRRTEREGFNPNMNNPSLS